VRFSRSKPGSFALAFVEPENGQVLQIEISAAERKEGGARLSLLLIFMWSFRCLCCTDGLTSARAGFKIKEQGGDRFFNSLHELVEYYNQYFVKPLTSDIVYASWFHGDISSAEAAELLQDKVNRLSVFFFLFSQFYLYVHCRNSRRIWRGRNDPSLPRAPLILSQEVGTFLLRFSLSQPGCFASSLVTPNGELRISR
jgi:hypothetical protein